MEKILLKQAPVFKIVVIFISGLIAATSVKIPLSTLLLANLLLVIMAIIFSFFIRRLVELIIVMGIFALAMLRYQMATEAFPKNHISHFTGKGAKVWLAGYVANHPLITDSTVSCEIEVEEIEISDATTLETSGKILLTCNSFTPVLERGDGLLICGVLKQPPGERNPGEFNYRKYLASQGIYGQMMVTDSLDCDNSLPPHRINLVDRTISGMRRYLERTLEREFQGQSGALLKGLLLGVRSEITPEIKQAFSKTGVMHVLAVSGLHVGFIVTIFSLCFRALLLPYRLRIILTMFCALLYMLVVGFMPPVVRATLIVELYLFGQLIERRSNPLNLVSTAAFIILLINPRQLFEASFQLSFIAFLSIIYFYKILQHATLRIPFCDRIVQSKIGNYIFQLLLVSIAASCGTLPLTIYYFEVLPVISILLNIVVIPLVFIIIAAGFLYFALALFIFPAAQLLAFGVNFLLRLLIDIVSISANFPSSYVPIYRFGILQILFLYFFLLLIFNLDKKICKKVLFILSLTLIFFMTGFHERMLTPWLEVTFLDVGQGDAALVKFPDGRTVLIDGGDKTERVDAGERHIVPLFRRQGIDRLDALMLSHSDNDHIGGMPYIMRHIAVDRVIDNGVAIDTELYLKYTALIDSLHLSYESLHAGERVEPLRYGSLFVLHPASDTSYNNLNNSSLVLKLIYGKTSFLFCGDIEQEVERSLLRFGPLLKSDVLKIPHHGSLTSSTLEFLKAVMPTYAVISVGESNRFDHPSTVILHRLDSLGIDTICTDENGAVIFQTNGERLERIR